MHAFIGPTRAALARVARSRSLSDWGAGLGPLSSKKTPLAATTGHGVAQEGGLSCLRGAAEREKGSQAMPWYCRRGWPRRALCFSPPIEGLRPFQVAYPTWPWCRAGPCGNALFQWRERRRRSGGFVRPRRSKRTCVAKWVAYSCWPTHGRASTEERTYDVSRGEILAWRCGTRWIEATEELAVASWRTKGMLLKAKSRDLEAISSP